MRAFDELLTIMATLRDPERGCPWDRAQSFASIVPHTLEEAYEVADAIERGALDELPDELGDLLFQVIFYARLGEEAGRFDMDAIAATLRDKLVRRHPHVFGETARVGDAQDQSRDWERIKAAERDTRAGREPASELDGVAAALPALSRAAKLSRRAARVGFDWEDAAGPLAKVREELAELERELDTHDRAARQRIEEELGDALFALSNLARKMDLDPEAALRGANRKFETRFRYIEGRLGPPAEQPEQGRLAVMERLWNEAKTTESGDSDSSGHGD